MTEYIKKEDAIQALMGHFIPQTFCGEEVEQAKNLAESIMDGVPTIEASEDCISRKGLQALFNETTTSLMDKIDQKDIEHLVRACVMVTEMIQDAPSVVPSKNLINRQDALDAIAKFVPYAIDDISTESYTNGLKDAYNLICQLPIGESDDE